MTDSALGRPLQAIDGLRLGSDRDLSLDGELARASHDVLFEIEDMSLTSAQQRGLPGIHKSSKIRRRTDGESWASIDSYLKRANQFYILLWWHGKFD
jgi:hypothetical protein